MSSDGNLDTSRAVVKAYVPAYQKEIWTDHADQLDMNQSEFLRTMVQAGRRGFDLDTGDSSTRNHEDDGSGGSTTEFSDEVLSILEGDGPMDWDGLIEQMTEDLEDRLEEAIESLQDDNQVRYSGRDDGYTVVEES